MASNEDMVSLHSKSQVDKKAKFGMHPCAAAFKAWASLGDHVSAQKRAKHLD